MTTVTEAELYDAILADVQVTPERTYYSPKEITAMLGCSPGTTYNLIHRNTWQWLRVSDNVIRVGRKCVRQVVSRPITRGKEVESDAAERGERGAFESGRGRAGDPVLGR